MAVNVARSQNGQSQPNTPTDVNVITAQMILSELKKTLKFTEQILTAEQQAQARRNLGIYDTSVPDSGSSSPISVIKNEDSEKKTALRSLASGIYILDGYFTAYEGGTHDCAFTRETLVIIVRSDDLSYVQIFHPESNTVKYLEISDSSVMEKDAELVNMQSITNLVTEINESADDEHYPSALAVYKVIKDIISKNYEIETSSASAITRKANGNIISVNNSADRPLKGLKLFGKTTQKTYSGKNLLPYPFHDTTKTTHGVTYTDNGDGTLTAKGTPTANHNFFFAHNSGKGLTLSGGITYSFKALQTTEYGNKFYVFVKYGEELIAYDYGEGITFTPPADYVGNVTVCALVDSDIDTVLKPQLEIAEAPTDWEPYVGGTASPNPEYPQEMVSVGDAGTIIVQSRGKNLFDISKVIDYDNGSGYGVFNKGDKIYVNLASDWANKSGAHPYALKDYAPELVVGQRYMLNATTTGNVKHIWLLNTVTGVSEAWSFGETKVITQEILGAGVYWYASGVGTSAEISNIQIELGSKATSYEPYKNGGTLTVSTPNGLPGIPVTSGGNYTDANGQQWICDEIDFARGVYVQRICRFIVSSTLSVGAHDNGQPYIIISRQGNPIDLRASVLSNRYIGGLWSDMNNRIYGISNNIVITDSRFTDVTTANNLLASEQPVVYYALNTSIETPLTEEELAKFRTIYSNKPNTTIMNDSNADMEVEYIADTGIIVGALEDRLNNLIDYEEVAF